MKPAFDVVVETGSRRCFARAVDWPGWCRSGRDPDAALEALAAYRRRYRMVAGRGFSPPESLRVAERLTGDATTDFGAPSIEAKADRRPLDAAELRRLTGLLNACRKAFEAAAAAAKGATLKTGPRGGGRDVTKMRAHVLEADDAYLRALGGTSPKGAEALYEAMEALLASRARGEMPELSPRRKSPMWAPRFAIARSAWHALDHAWEIEDRMPG